jgi:uncharacterized protein HemX
MDRSKPKAVQPSVAPAPSPPHRRRTQFTIFGLMVLMFVLSLSFSQMFYWSRAEQRWKQQAVERAEQEKAAAQAEKDASNAANTGTSAPAPKSTPAAPPKPPHDADSGDAAIAILMAVALPMLVMIIASVVYNVRKSLRRRRR